MVSFRSNGKNIQQYKINFHLFIIKETINKKNLTTKFGSKDKESTLE
jgi:hypothetical protein